MKTRTLLITTLVFGGGVVGCQDHAKSKQQQPAPTALAPREPQVSAPREPQVSAPATYSPGPTVIGVNTTRVNWDGKLAGVRVAILAADGFEEAQLVDPRQAYADQGASTVIIAPKTGEIQGYKRDVKADRVKVDMPIEEADPDQFDALELPGGAINGDAMRTNPKARAFVKAFGQSGKPIAAIGDGLGTMLEAGIVRGRTVTSSPSLKSDLKSAGAKWVDKEVAVDRNFVTTRMPDDVSAFNAKTIKVFAKHRPAIGGGPAPE